MRNSIIVSGFLFLLAACAQPQVNVEKDEFVHVTSEWNIEINRHLFSSPDVKTDVSLQVLNRKVGNVLEQVLEEVKSSADEYFAQYEDKNQAVKFELRVEDSVFMADSKFISLRLKVYTYKGGAHGGTNFYTYNYDIASQSLLQPEQIIDMVQAERFNELLRMHFRNSNCFSELPAVENMDGLNVDEENVCVVFQQYTLGAYACGHAEIAISRDDLQGVLSRSFLDVIK